MDNPRPPSHEAAVRRFGIADPFLIALLVVLAFAFIPFMRAAAPAVVVVRRDKTIIARYPVDRDMTFRVSGAQGPLDICIARHGVSVVRATCKNQICVNTGRISHSYQQIVCAPNHVTVTVSAGAETDSIDALTR